MFVFLYIFSTFFVVVVRKNYTTLLLFYVAEPLLCFLMFWTFVCFTLIGAMIRLLFYVFFFFGGVIMCKWSNIFFFSCF